MVLEKDQEWLSVCVLGGSPAETRSQGWVALRRRRARQACALEEREQHLIHLCSQ